MDTFQSHHGFARTFKENKLTLGLTFPLESYVGSFPTMDLDEQMILAKKAENSRVRLFVCQRFSAIRLEFR